MARGALDAMRRDAVVASKRELYGARTGHHPSEPFRWYVEYHLGEALLMSQMHLADHGMSRAMWITEGSHTRGYTERPSAAFERVSCIAPGLTGRQLRRLEARVVKALGRAYEWRSEELAGLTLTGLLAWSLRGPDRRGEITMPAAVADCLPDGTLGLFIELLDEQLRERLHAGWLRNKSPLAT
jgi:hypothetical protein